MLARCHSVTSLYPLLFHLWGGAWVGCALLGKVCDALWDIRWSQLLLRNLASGSNFALRSPSRVLVLSLSFDRDRGLGPCIVSDTGVVARLGSVGRSGASRQL